MIKGVFVKHTTTPLSIDDLLVVVCMCVRMYVRGVMSARKR